MLPRYTFGLVASLLVGCETTLPQPPNANAPNVVSVFTRTPDRDYRLPEAVRTRLPPSIDAEALEALLARVRPEYRAQMLDSFQHVPAEAQGRPVAYGPESANTGDPEIDALVRRVRRAPNNKALGVPAQSRPQSACPAGFAHDDGALRKTLGAAASVPDRPELDYARLSREQARPLNTAADQAVCARLDSVFRITTEEQRTRQRSYFALATTTSSSCLAIRKYARRVSLARSCSWIVI